MAASIARTLYRDRLDLLDLFTTIADGDFDTQIPRCGALLRELSDAGLISQRPPASAIGRGLPVTLTPFGSEVLADLGIGR